MKVIRENVAGIDVGKREIAVCVRTLGADDRPTKEVRSFGTMTDELREMSQWLLSQSVTHVAMESTGVYWKPVWNVLEDDPFELLLVNARDMKQLPGRPKTDVKDCEWIASLLQHGLLRGSFVPSRALRHLRDLTRMRTKILDERTRVANRLQKVYEDANIKLASVISDPLGVSGRAMLRAIVEGQDDPAALARLATSQLRAERSTLERALDGHVTDHHRFMLGFLFEQVLRLETSIAELDDRIDRVTGQVPHGHPEPDAELSLFPTPDDDDVPSPDPPSPAGVPTRRDQTPEASSSPPRGSATDEPVDDSLTGFAAAVDLLCSIPGIQTRSAENVLAETGLDMSRFPTSGHLASWAGLCPGTKASAGKRQSGRITKGNAALKRTLVQAAWCAVRKRGSYFGALFRRLKSRRGSKRAIVAVAHSILVAIYHMLETGAFFEDLGADFFDKRNTAGLLRYHTRRLAELNAALETKAS